MVSCDQQLNPDIDNLAKGIKDGLSKVIWRDDSQVTELIARKWYSHNPRAEVTIEWHQK
ncbi:RusA family crossover junction endodeoxyribonuclease [Lysinibacillus sp. FSL R7-0073]|uniref:RusA family crossover junction endodeoxyribonuclease n=1 Tax=Lysinibacillus sp. FSL R7-0073 TaxID=2921669 RepID=UPI0030F7CDDC